MCQIFKILCLAICITQIKAFIRLSLARDSILRKSLHHATTDLSPNSYTPNDLTVYLIGSINTINKESWNQFITETTSPFIHYEWLHSLEASECVSMNEGWDPIHLVVGTKHNTAQYDLTMVTTVAICPLYVKYHSMGEFIFDQQWAAFAQDALQLRYYPKILSAIPFTPGTGPRILYSSQLSAEVQTHCMKLLIQAMKSLTVGNKILSSNVNFMLSEEVSTFLKEGYDLRQTIQYRWENKNPLTNESFIDFDDYLNCFKSKRRIQIKRERKSIYEDQKIQVKVIRGDDPEATLELYETMYHLYTTTIDKMWGQQYLNKQFFQLLYNSTNEFKHKLIFILAYNNDTNKVIAGTFNVVSQSHFYGRYWGTFEYTKNLHFELCYYAAIEYCIQQHIQYMEPGAGGGEYKFLRGFNPFLIYSVHYFTNTIMKRAIGEFLEQERLMNQENADYLIANAVINKASANTTTTTSTTSTTSPTTTTTTTTTVNSNVQSSTIDNIYTNDDD